MPVLSRSQTILIFAAFGAALSGCGEQPQIRQYVTETENERDITSELLRGEFPTIPFRWDVPESWIVASNDRFSVRAWTVGPATEQARITLGKFPARTGIPAQVTRWRRQVGLEAGGAEEAMENVTALKTQNGGGSYATVEGPKQTILAFILPVQTDFWIFRYKSSNSIAQREADRFRRFCKSLEYVASKTPSTQSRFGPNPSLPRQKPEAEQPRQMPVVGAKVAIDSDLNDSANDVQSPDSGDAVSEGASESAGTPANETQDTSTPAADDTSVSPEQTDASAASDEEE